MPDRMLAEYKDEETIVAAIHQLHRDGYRRLEAYIPFPSHAIERALGQPPSRLPYAIFGVGVSAAAGAYGLQWLLVGHLYPLIVGGRPPHFPLAFLIITFEMGVLFSALAAFFGTLVAGKLVRLVDDVQGTPGFGSATRDAFWLEISMRDPAFDENGLRRVLVECGAVHVTTPEGPP